MNTTTLRDIYLGQHSHRTNDTKLVVAALEAYLRGGVPRDVEIALEALARVHGLTDLKEETMVAAEEFVYTVWITHAAPAGVIKCPCHGTASCTHKT